MTDSEVLALQFVTALKAGDFAAAHGLLTTAERERCRVSALERSWVALVPSGSGADIAVTATLEMWLDRQTDDMSWVYVSVVGPDWVEAVAVVVALEQGVSRVREVHWGRP